MTYSKEVINQVKEVCHTAFTGAGIALAIFTVGHLTGCNSFIAAQAELDVSSSTVYPRIDSADMTVEEFQAQAQYASKRLAEMKEYAQGESE